MNPAKSALCGLLLAALSASAGEHVMRATRPAPDSIDGWEQESYPIGNGWFGVSVFGGLPEERLQVTENSFLTRDRLLNLTSALDLRIKFLRDSHSPSNVAGYVRSLHLEQGVSRVAYSADGADCTWRDGRPVRVVVRAPVGIRPVVCFDGQAVDAFFDNTNKLIDKKTKRRDS